MTNDLKDSFDWITKNFETKEIYIMGHSSGAHMISLSSIKFHETFSNIKAFILLSGVYDIPMHYEYECGRGVEEYSGLKGAMISIEQFQLNSPFHLFDSFDIKIPKTFIFHGDKDDIVPMEQSVKLYQKMKKMQQVDFISLKDFDHSETVLNLMDYGDDLKKKLILGEILKIIE
jgi:dipeptidyl aminopeptidase/acylaminoacyl peptidase